jgi:regulator of RNase E activity RraA
LPVIDDATLFETIRTQLFTAVIGDILDVAGHTHQFLPPEIRAVQRDTVLVGRAMPVLEADCFGEVVVSAGQPHPFGLMFRALDDLRPGEIYITTGASPRYALWGGLMSTRAKSLGAAGAVLDGYHRDTREIEALGFPVFSSGSYAQDQRLRGRVIDFRCPIEFRNAVRVSPGDVIVGDIDGVVVIPAAHLQDVVADALKKVRGEEAVRDMIMRGERTEAIYEQTGIM